MPLVVGRGMNGKELLSSIERAEIKSDGTLSEWTMEKAILNIPRRCVKTGGYRKYHLCLWWIWRNFVGHC